MTNAQASTVMIAGLSAILLAFVSFNTHSYEVEDLEYLTGCIYFEARSESTAGQYAVAHVVMNRVADRRWGNTVKKVVTQRLQFSYRNGKSADDIIVGKNKEAWRKAELIAHNVLSGLHKDNTGGADHYLRIEHSTDLSWYKKLIHTKKIGHHDFYK